MLKQAALPVAGKKTSDHAIEARAPVVMSYSPMFGQISG
jgi:hypothetical protein